MRTRYRCCRCFLLQRTAYIAQGRIPRTLSSITTGSSRQIHFNAFNHGMTRPLRCVVRTSKSGVMRCQVRSWNWSYPRHLINTYLTRFNVLVANKSSTTNASPSWLRCCCTLTWMLLTWLLYSWITLTWLLTSWTLSSSSGNGAGGGVGVRGRVSVSGNGSNRPGKLAGAILWCSEKHVILAMY